MSEGVDGDTSAAADGTRLARCVAGLVGCSRREAEQYIEGGWVTVDGVVVESPQYPVLAQQVALLPGARLDPPEAATFVLHKPAGATLAETMALIVPGNEAPGAGTGLRTLQRHFLHLRALLPLADAAAGLFVATQDPKVVRRLDDDAARLEHELNVEVTGEIALYGLARLNHGLGDASAQGLPTAKVSWQSETRLRFAMKAPQPGQVEAMCAAVGLQVLSIKRLRIGRISMGKLPVGQWRRLAGHERF